MNIDYSSTYYVGGASYVKNPPGVNLSPTPITEDSFNRELEKQKGIARALKIQIELEKNRGIGWDIATLREKNVAKSVTFDRAIETVKQEKYALTSDRIDTETSRKAIDHARLRGKLSDAEKSKLEITLGGKADENRYLTEVRKIQKDKHELALKVGKLDFQNLQAEYDNRRNLLRQQGLRG
jgi:hypothetical protein